MKGWDHGFKSTLAFFFEISCLPWAPPFSLPCFDLCTCTCMSVNFTVCLLFVFVCLQVRERDCEIMHDSNGRSTGIAYVTFQSRSLANQAIREKDGKHIGTRYVELSLYWTFETFAPLDYIQYGLCLQIDKDVAVCCVIICIIVP